MKNKNVRGVIALAVVTALSFGVILGSKALAKNTSGTEGAGDKVTEELDVKGAENIEKAVKTESGYMVTVKEKGYGGDILMEVSFDDAKETVTKVAVTEQAETEGLGAKIAEPEFLSQFEGAKAPVYLPGMSLEEEDNSSELKDAKLQDGSYEAKAANPDSSGYTDQVKLTVKDGKITEVTWEATDAQGNKKSVLSENGEYVMTEDGLTWKEQAEALSKALIENQSLDFLKINEQGKTDAVSGVSIAVSGFADLAEQCMQQAAGLTQNLELKDGSYEAKSEAPDNSGYTDQVNLTVKDGKIIALTWEATDAEGNKKSVLSENGEYVMTEDGLTWKEQSEALAAAVIENQSLDFLKINEQGKTDAVSGVSIAVSGFTNLVEQCLSEAAGVEAESVAPQEGTEVDAVSGATISSTAAVRGINAAYEFLKTVK